MITPNSYNSLAEKELLLRIEAGDEHAFSSLVDGYWKKVYGHALAYSKSVVSAEELAQDVFMDIWKYREKLTSIEHFPNFIYIVTRNRVFKFLRQKLTINLLPEDFPLKEDIWLPAEQAELRELNMILLEGIQSLPPMRKQVFELSRMEGLSYEEISNRLGISRNTVKEHIAKALNTLRLYLAKRDNLLLIILVTTLVGTLKYIFSFFLSGNHPR